MHRLLDKRGFVSRRIDGAFLICVKTSENTGFVGLTLVPFKSGGRSRLIEKGSEATLC